MRLHLTAVASRAHEHSPKTDGELTIEQLACETGMTVRNIRNHQSRGLLPPPEVRARTGYYGPQHVARLRLIQEMQAEGFNLSGDPAPARRAGRRGRAVHRPAPGDHGAVRRPRRPRSSRPQELAERFGRPTPRLLAKAEKLGCSSRSATAASRRRAPRCCTPPRRSSRCGIPLGRRARAARQGAAQRRSRRPRTFVDLFLDELWKPFDDAGQPEEQWPEITESIERLRPLAAEALLAIFKQTMTDEVEDAFGRMLEHQARSPRSRG